MVETSYGRNKNHDDEIKKTKRRPIIAPAIAVRLLKMILVLFSLFQNQKNNLNIAGRLPENSRNRFVDRQFKKDSKKDRPKNSSFH